MRNLEILSGMKLSSRLSRSAYDALTDVSKESTDLLTNALKRSDVPEIVRFLGNVSAGFLSRLGLAYLKHILKIEDSGEKLAKDVSKLVSSPLATGMEQLHLAGELEPRPGTEETSEEFRHRQERYRDALRSLDQARQLATPEEVPSIDLLRGLASLHLSGAQAEARIHLNSYVEFCESSSLILEERINTLSETLARNELQLNKMPTYKGGRGGGGLVGMDIALSIAKRAELINRVASMKQEIAATESERYELLVSSSVIKSVAASKSDTAVI